MRRLGGVLLLLVVGLAAHRLWTRGADPLRTLVTASEGTSRAFEGRLSGGFEWAAVRRDAAERTNPRVLAAAVAILRRDADPHASAVARMAAGDVQAAAASLEAVAREGESARAWSDLAVAHLHLAQTGDDPSRLARALVAVDRALAIDPRSVEARFNRALVLEHLGLRDLARIEWESYLAADAASGWAAEARARLKVLAPEADFRDVLKRDYDRLAADPAAAHAFARRFRQAARTWGETEILGDWGSAVLAGDTAAAAKHLRLARELGAELAREDGNRTTAAMVEAIDAAADAPRLRLLARAHVAFRDGRREFRDHHRPAAAQRLYERAADDFAGGGSPAELRARSYAANMDFEQGRLDAARAAHERFLASAPSAFPAHRAETLWMIGTIACAQGRFGRCLNAWTESVAVFERLGETNHAARVRAQLVYALDRLGAPAQAWQNRMPTLREHGRRLATPQVEALASISRAAVMTHDWLTARSFLDLELEVARRIPDPRQVVQSLLYRAEVHRRMERNADARADLAAARRGMRELQDPQYLGFMEAFAKGVEGPLAADPRNGVALLSEAIEFMSTRGRRMYVPELLRKRGRAFQAMGDLARAAEDFEAGVTELESHRETLPGGKDRWGVFHAADELFGDAIALAVARDDAQLAFDYAERARARALLDTLGTPWRRVTPAEIPADTVLIEYAAHERATFAFVVDRRAVRVFRLPAARKQLAAEIAALADAAADADAARLARSGRTLHRLLFAPIADAVAPGARLAFVPDPALGCVSFAALLDGEGRFLVERHPITVASSAAFFTRVRQAPRGVPADVLVVTGAEDAGPLAAAEREARMVAQMYARAKHLESPTADAFRQAATAAGVIHFAGHGVGGRRGHLLLAGRSAEERRLDVDEIAAMRFSRTALVVLAACETAGGEVRGTEGTISVARAFLAAGVPSVVGTLWPVEDEASATLFAALHRALARGARPADALRLAQIECIRGGDPSAVWAAVQIVGE